MGTAFTMCCCRAAVSLPIAMPAVRFLSQVHIEKLDDFNGDDHEGLEAVSADEACSSDGFCDDDEGDDELSADENDRPVHDIVASI